MPSVIVYIRQTDYDKWLAIEKKSEWLHVKLNNDNKVLLSQHVKDVDYTVNEPYINPARLKNVETKAEVFVPKPPDPETGYPCCQTSKPCKHWHFNGDRQMWENEITGKTREPGHE